MGAPTTAADIHTANVRYHDLAAAHYDEKWGIDFGERGRSQVVAKLAKALGAAPAEPFAKGLEIGAGTGYFGLNLALGGIVRELTATDISSGMLDVLAASAAELSLDVATAACAATALPFPDDSFDLVFGHAVLHHLPGLDAAFAEFRRVLRPGGAIAFCGEPSRYGDRIAALPKRAAHLLSPAWRTLVGARPAARYPRGEPREEELLEGIVDVHAFTPSMLVEPARRAGFTDVSVSGEELAASLFGWANRTLEASAEPADVPWVWHQWAYRGYLGLQALDRSLLEPRLPAAVFYNLLLSARAPLS